MRLSKFLWKVEPMGLREDILREDVSQLEWRDVLKVQPTNTVRDTVELMRKHRLGCVIIVSDDGKVVGKFTERDLIRLLLLNAESLDEEVGHHMSGTWGMIHEGDPIAQVIDLMQEKKLRFVVVVDEDNRPIGLTGQKGVMEYIVDHFPRQVKVQMMESKLFMDTREGG